jgi:hypothetical protein
MTMQNLDVYGTFQVRVTSLINQCEINSLVIDTSANQELLNADGSTAYSVDLVTKKALLWGLSRTGGI